MENNKNHKTPNANKKLRNVETIQKMLDGTHKSQTRKTISTYVGKKDTTKREVGDRWTDSNGVVWEQRDGYRVQGVDRLDRIASVRDYLSIPSECPKCGGSMKHKNDKKFWRMEKQCFNCQIEFETELRRKGEYKDYERKKILDNVNAWLTDASREKEYLKKELAKTSYVNGDGTLEKWDLPYDIEEMKEKIDTDFERFRFNLLKKYGATQEELDALEYKEEQNEENKT